MRILTWNILHGGGSRRIPGILLAMLELRPDVVVVTEARRGFGGQLAGALADAGLPYALDTDPPRGTNGVMLIARHPLERVGVDAPACLRHRWLEARMPDEGMTLAGVHLPEASRRTDHAAAWKFAIGRAGEGRDVGFVVAGDLNTWRDGPSHRPRNGASSRNLGRMAALGFVDAWSAAPPSTCGTTWKSHTGSGYRLDYVLVSGGLAPRLRGVSSAPHVLGERLSDHVPVVADLGPEPQNPCV